MNKRTKTFLFALAGMTVLSFTSCHDERMNTAYSTGSSSNTPTGVSSQQEESERSDPLTESLGYEQITPQEAKVLMDTETGYVILDVRSQAEYETGHIEGALLIPDYEVAERASFDLPDKDQLILVYCRTGRRSKLAAETLVSLGYTNVKEFGGIYDWPYEIVT